MAVAEVVPLEDELDVEVGDPLSELVDVDVADTYADEVALALLVPEGVDDALDDSV